MNKLGINLEIRLDRQLYVRINNTYYKIRRHSVNDTSRLDRILPKFKYIRI